MRYLGLALFAEGPTDHRFLRPVLWRLTEDIFLPEPVEMGEVLELHSPVPASGPRREERIFTAARDALGAWNILFIHADGAGNPGDARSEKIEPARQRIAAELEGAGESVAVVPVRETEAWALCDPDALRRAIGITLSAEDLALTGSVESIADPKAALQQVGKRIAGRRGARRTLGSEHFLQRLGEYVDLERLRTVPAFRQLDADLREALRRLRIVR